MLCSTLNASRKVMEQSLADSKGSKRSWCLTMIVENVCVMRKDSADVPVGELDRAEFRRSDWLFQCLHINSSYLETCRYRLVSMQQEDVSTEN